MKCEFKLADFFSDCSEKGEFCKGSRNINKNDKTAAG